MPDEFTALPLRKDYPLQGRGERHNFPVLTPRPGYSRRCLPSSNPHGH